MGAAVAEVEAVGSEAVADTEVAVESRTLKGRAGSERIRKAVVGMDWEALRTVGLREASIEKATQSRLWDLSQKVLCSASGLARCFCRINGQFD